MSCGSLSPSAAAAVFASRAEIPIRIAPVTSFNSAQRPVSSSSSSQRASCFGSSVLPRVRSVVTTSVRVGGGLLWRWSGRGASLPLPLAGEVGSPDSAFALSGDPGGGSFAPQGKLPDPHPNPPPQAGEGADCACGWTFG